MKWFNNPQTAEELKEQYRRLALKNHPDMGGKKESMQEINNEYDSLFARLKDIHKTVKGDIYTAKKTTTETPEEFRHIIDQLFKMENIVIELCGSWLWLTGNTITYKDELKSMGFKWAVQKKAWYFHHGDYHKRSRKTMTMENIRKMYGSSAIVPESERLQIA